MLKRIFILLIILVLILGTYLFKINDDKLKMIDTFYLANDDKEITLLNENKEEILFNRGNLVDVYINKEIKINDEIYKEIKYNDQKYYVKEDFLTKEKEEIVKEKKIYTLVNQVLYEDINSAKIAKYLFENEELNIISYNNLLTDGSVDYYYVEKDGIKGYVKNNDYYLNKDYYDQKLDPSNLINISGDLAGNIKYYPRDIEYIEGNIMPDITKTLYINADTCKDVDKYLEIARSSGINSFVIDIKDTQVISYDSKVVKEYAPSSEEGRNTFEEYKEVIKKLNDEGYYTIGRITVFKDPGYAKDHPEDIIELEGKPYHYNNSYWPSIFSRKVWEYNVSLALEAVNNFHFNEIQFDYVRLPEIVPSNADMHNIYNETNAEAITNFIYYARDVLHNHNAYLSIDVFGEIVAMQVSPYGQYWPAISNAADVISAMPYPDHFGRGYYGIEEPWKEPYLLMYYWGQNAYKCQLNTFNPAKVRTWIQVYDSIIDNTVYDANKVKDQIKALSDNNINDGYITWNGAASYLKFAYVKDAFE